MLQRLEIQNIAIIDKIEIELRKKDLRVPEKPVQASLLSLIQLMQS